MGEAAFVLQISPQAARQLQRLSPPIRRNVAQRIDGLAANPHPQMAKPLKGMKGVWRLRVGDYRVIYLVEGRRVLVLDIGHRRDVYRGL